jgi:hypothetical protein
MRLSVPVLLLIVISTPPTAPALTITLGEYSFFGTFTQAVLNQDPGSLDIYRFLAVNQETPAASRVGRPIGASHVRARYDAARRASESPRNIVACPFS